MRTFKDAQDREWSIDVTIGKIKAVRNAVKIDLANILADEATRLFRDPVQLVDTLYVLCRDQCAQRQMRDEDFGRLFQGDVLEAAATALLEALIDFFPNSRRRILRATVEKAMGLNDQVEAEAMKIIEQMTWRNLSAVTHTSKPGGSAEPSA